MLSSLVLLVMFWLFDAFVVLIDKAGPAFLVLGFNQVAAFAWVAMEVRRWRRGAARPVALIGGLAKRRFGSEEETAVFTGVIDLDQLSVFVLRSERVAGEEVDVGAVGAGAEQFRVEATGAGGNQTQAIARALAEGRAFGIAAAGAGRLPLIDIGEVVGIAQRQRIFGVEEELAGFGEAGAV